MKLAHRGPTIAFALSLFSAVIAGQGGQPQLPTSAERPGEQRLIVDRFNQLPDGIRRQIEQEAEREGIKLPPNLTELAQKGQLPKGPDETIFRSVRDGMKPIPIRQGSFREVFPNRLAAAAIPQGAEAQRMWQRTQSVGRIEVGGESRHVGTGFVVGPGLLATNCHVLRELASQSADGRWVLTGGRSFAVDFGDSRAHEETNEFLIESVAGYSPVRFLDVALLRVRTKSRSGNRDLPAPIPLRTLRLTDDLAKEPLPVGVVGYPHLANLVGDADTQAIFRRIRESGADHVKVFSPGEVIGVDSLGGIEFLNHVASTHLGQSGSPVLDRATGEAVGIHFCCAEPGRPELIDALACSSQRISNRVNNEAISSWTAVGDETLRPFLQPQPPGSSAVNESSRHRQRR